MSKLVEISKEVGKFELAVNELREIRDAWRQSKNIKDVIELSGDKLTEVFVRYTGLVGQVIALEGFYSGLLSPKEVVTRLLVIEGAKVGLHYTFKGGYILLDYIHRKQAELRSRD